MLKYTLSMMLLLISLMSYGADFVAGKDYEIIKDSNKLGEITKTVNVIEFFSYGCPWCFRLEPALNQWVALNNNKINFKKIPVVFNKDWEYYARAYYTANALGLDSKMNAILFKAILDDKKPLNSTQAMIDFFTKNGVDAATAQSAFTQSPSIDLEVHDSQAMMGHFHVTSVPTIVIDDQFKTDLQMAKTQERLFAILDFLLTQSVNVRAIHGNVHN